MIKVAIVGFGFSAKTFHLPFIKNLPDFQLVAISSSQQDAVTNDYPEIKYFASAEAMITETEADLIIITSPNNTHFPLAKLALENDKHVIIEKPFVTHSKDGETLIELAKKQQKVLSVYHNRRWDGDFLTVKNLIENQQLGEIKLYESHFDRFRPEVRDRWRETAEDGGGILFDLAPHLLDQTLHLFGMPSHITAQCKIMRNGSTNVDYFHITLHYSGKLTMVTASLFSAGPNPRFRIQGDMGSYEKYGLDPQEERLIAGVVPNEPSWAEEPPENYGTLYHANDSHPLATERGGYQGYFQNIADAISGKHELLVTADQALLNIKLIELAMQSSQLAKTLAVDFN